MSVKTFQAPSMAEVLAKVKGELGSDAVILHTRSFKQGGVMGLMSRDMVEVTASKGDGAAPPRRRAMPRVKPMEMSATTGEETPIRTNQDRSSERSNTEQQARNLLREAYARSQPQKKVETSAPAEKIGNTRDLAAAVLNQPAFEIRNEIAALRTMVESLLQRAPQDGPRADLPAQLAQAYRTLVEQEVAEELANRIVEDVRCELTADQLVNPHLVRERLVNRIEKMMPGSVNTAVSRPTTGTGCRSICLIGPTGVGKTTTIAKLAAAFKLRQKQKVGLITIDTYRIAAVDQLRTYANIIGVPVRVVLTPSELVVAMQELKNCDTILIDTAGRSPTDEVKIGELARFIQAGNPTEVHLVLSSTCTQSAMEAAFQNFSRIRIDQIIFTKLDEAVSFGVLLNIIRKASKALSYVTTGQDVPDHVEVGQPRRLARLILGEKL